ncbi:MAG: orotidine-5'-phosphate decarboxylase [Deltaproteobacteria bacterium]|nr:orotidine-5'-phosphate decarboxylase [Deltaproteobacteria bacterium]
MKTPKDYIIFPLDFENIDQARSYVKLLHEKVGMFKVGLELFIAEGPSIVDMIKNESDVDIFLDLKLHDIPATVAKAVKSVSNLGVKFLTVHCGESKKMLKQAVEAADNKVEILGVTVLTSVASNDIEESGFKKEYHSDVKQLVLKRAGMAKECGCPGIVCSGQETHALKKEFGDGLKLITPGIRPSWSSKDDQKRIVTPAEAIKNGSDYLVIGRPIRSANDPIKAAEKVAEEIAEI